MQMFPICPMPTHPLTDAWQHQCLFSASHQMYWWMSSSQHCCLWCFSKLFYCGKQSYSQFWSLCSNHRVVPEPIYISFLSWTRGLGLLSEPAGTDQFSSRHPGKKEENFRKTLEFNQVKPILKKMKHAWICACILKPMYLLHTVSMIIQCIACKREWLHANCLLSMVPGSSYVPVCSQELWTESMSGNNPAFQ